MRRLFPLLLVLTLLTTAGSALAQGGSTALPENYQIANFRHEYQGWNNCGPATLTTALSHYGWQDDQLTAAHWLKPDSEDKNVSPWQMVAFVNEMTPQRALMRYGGTLDLLRTLIANDFPVVIEAGYQPEGYDWMGHYLLVMGYDQPGGTFLTQDSFLGPDRPYSAEEIDYHWQHFNRLFIVVYAPEREGDLLALLGADADAQANAARALEAARQEAATDSSNPFAWFNMGTSYVALGRYDEAAVAFDQARNTGNGLPWRMLWYQFGPFEAYYQIGRYEDVIALAQYNLATTPEGEHPIEETYYYAGLARAAMDDNERATLNLRQAALINPNFQPAADALAQLEGAG